MILNSKNKKMLLASIIANYFLQFVTIISSLIIPRIILSKYGSEANGLIGSINQFLSYITIIEGGLGGVFSAFMYKPIVENDRHKISSVVVTAKRIYQKIALVLGLYSLVLAVVYPLMIGSKFSALYVSSMTLILSGNMFMQYYFTTINRELLKADKKMYICSLVQSIAVILNLGVFIVLSNFVDNLHFLKLASAIVYLIQPILLSRYIKKHYNIDKNAENDQSLIKSRWDGFSINIAHFIHDCTDISVLTLFTNLSTVSIYTVYAIITTGARRTLQSISSALSPNIGHIYASGDTERLKRKFYQMELIYFAITSFVFTIIVRFAIPFVYIYVGDITDAEYIQPLFAVIFIAAEYMYCIREPYFNLAQAAKAFKDIKKHAYIEAILNIIISVVLVNIYGLIGVAIGTFVAVMYRTVYHILYLKRHILFYRIGSIFKKLVIYSIASLLSLCIYDIVRFDGSGVINFFVNIILCSSITAVIYITVTYILFLKKDKKIM